MLSGKYVNGDIPAGSRRALNESLSGRYNENSKTAIENYLAVAEKHNIPLAQLALAFCMERPFMASTIIGATSMEQLKINIGAADVSLTDEIRADIDAVYRQNPVPM